MLCLSAICIAACGRPHVCVNCGVWQINTGSLVSITISKGFTFTFPSGLVPPAWHWYLCSLWFADHLMHHLPPPAPPPQENVVFPGMASHSAGISIKRRKHRFCCLISWCGRHLHASERGDSQRALGSCRTAQQACEAQRCAEEPKERLGQGPRVRGRYSFNYSS